MVAVLKLRGFAKPIEAYAAAVVVTGCATSGVCVYPPNSKTAEALVAKLLTDGYTIILSKSETAESFLASKACTANLLHLSVARSVFLASVCKSVLAVKHVSFVLHRTIFTMEDVPAGVVFLPLSMGVWRNFLGEQCSLGGRGHGFKLLACRLTRVLKTEAKVLKVSEHYFI